MADHRTDPADPADPAPLVLSMGEPAGVGPDLILAVAKLLPSRALPSLLVTGDHDIIAARCKALGEAPEQRFVRCDNANDLGAVLAGGDRLPVLQTVPCAAPTKAGHPDPANAASVIDSIETGVSLIHQGQAAGLVTNPIQKETLYAAGFSFPGHTEFLADLGTRLFGARACPVMLIHTPELSTVPVTIHIPIAEVAASLTTQRIVETCRITAHDLAKRLGVPQPRLAIAGLNPHAGEGGQIGVEDRDIVAPAIEILKAEGIDARGPLPADTMFHAAARKTYDVAICMYHDQALIPAKTLGFDVGVNTTLGLPFIRTSPDHGTALDIAGSGRARPDSLLAALHLAARMVRHSQHVST
jgi:4-hydroxythreonine-4-phosphate dehydrogenase